MSITTALIPQNLRPGLACVLGEHDQYKQQWEEIYEIFHSDKQQEIEVEMKFLGLAQYRPEGAPTAVDTMQQRVVTSYVHKYFGLSFVITRMALLDNLYKSQFPMMTRSLKNALNQTKNVMGASLFNNSANTAYPIGDGQPLLSLSHPIVGGFVANTTSVATDLSEAAIENAIISIQQFKDQAGNIVETRAKKLLVPAQGEFTAERLLGSQYRVDTNVNTISAIFSLKSIPQGYVVNQFLSPLMPNAWYVLTDCPNSFKHYVREEPETDVYTEQSTDNLIAKAVERYSFGCSDFRGIFGNTGQ